MIEILGADLLTLCLREKPEALLERRFLAAWQERHKGMSKEDVRNTSLVGLLLLQTAGVRGTLAYDRFGRPYLAESGVDFNITHSGSKVFCAVERTSGQGNAPTPRVGIDAEEMSGRGQLRTSDLARRWFSENEQATFYAEPTKECFLRIWTRKEALGKALGLGLAHIGELDTTRAENATFSEIPLEGVVITVCQIK